MNEFTALWVSITLMISTLAALRFKRRNSQLPLPPGPKPWPIIGNILDVPTVRPWETYHEWCRTYGTHVHY